MIGVRHDYSWAEVGLSFGATLVLTVLAVTSLALRYVTSPISCFTPAQFESSHVDFARKYCFQASTIYAPVPSGESSDGPPNWSIVTYHQWFPFFLGLSAMLCLLPHVIWRMLSACFLWLDLHPLTVSLSANQSAANRHVMLRDCALLLQAGFKKGNAVLAVTALARKALGCGVCFLQMLLMVLAFKSQIEEGGEEGEDDASLLATLEGNVPTQANGSVPLPIGAFKCRFSVPRFSNLHRYEVLCTLTVAPVYTKGQVFLLLAFLVLFILCFLDLTFCALHLLMPRLKDVTLSRFLALSSQTGGRPDSSDSPNPAHVARFLDSLGLDGRWVISVVSDRCGALTGADLTNHLMQVFKDSPHPSPATPSPGKIAEEDASAVPLVTIGADDGDAASEDVEKGKRC